MATPPSITDTFTMGIRAAGGGNPNLISRFYWTITGPTSGTVIDSYTTSDTTWRTTGPSTCAASTFRPGGGSWTLADFANSTTLFPRIFHDTGGGGGNVLLSSFFGQIQFQPPFGGFAFLLGLAGLMSLQIAGPMTDYTQFEKFLQWRHDVHPRHTILAAEEKVTAWDEYKSYRAPRFFYG
jgi:hypothetical protein